MKKPFFQTIYLLLILQIVTGCAARNGEQFFQKGEEFYKTGDFETAHKYALDALKETPEKFQYRVLLGWIHFRKGNIREAFHIFSRLYEREKDNIQAVQGLAWSSYSMGKEDAGFWFNKELQWAGQQIEHPDRSLFSRTYIQSIASDAHYGSGLTALKHKDYEGARAHFSNALNYTNDFVGHGPIREAFADSYFLEKKYEDAISHYENIIGQTRNDTTIVNYARSLYYTNKAKQADILLKRHYPEAIDKRPYLYALVFTSKGINKPVKSEFYLNELIQLDPYYADATEVWEIIDQTKNRNLFLKKFADVYFEKGDFPRAHYMLTPYIHENPHDCDARLKEAWCDTYSGRLMISITEFDSILRNASCNHNQALVGRGVALFYLKMYEEAAAAFSKAASMNPDNIRARVALGAVTFMKGNYQKAIDIYFTYLNQLPKKDLYFSWSSHALNNLGWSYIYTGQYKKALEIFNRLKLHHDRPIFPQPFSGTGWAYFHMSKTDRARESFDQALLLDPDNASALEGLKKIRFSEKHTSPSEKQTPGSLQ